MFESQHGMQSSITTKPHSFFGILRDYTKNPLLITTDQTQWIKQNLGGASEEKERDLSYKHAGSPPLVSFTQWQRKKRWDKMSGKWWVKTDEQPTSDERRWAASGWWVLTILGFAKSITYDIFFLFSHFSFTIYIFLT